MNKKRFNKQFNLLDNSNKVEFNTDCADTMIRKILFCYEWYMGINIEGFTFFDARNDVIFLMCDFQAVIRYLYTNFKKISNVNCFEGIEG